MSSTMLYAVTVSVDGIMPIPHKKKDTLVTFGLVSRIHLESDWTEDEVKAKVRSAFNDATGGDNSFPFRLQGQDQSQLWSQECLPPTNGHPEKLQVMQIFQIHTFGKGP